VTVLAPEAFAIIAFIFGLCFGSFLNVCIYRLPRGKSILGRSKCPNCDQPVRPYYNVPVLGWLLIRGRCAECKHPIPARYAVIEALVGLLFAACVLHYGVTLIALKFAIFGFLIIGLVFTDYDLHLLPDALTLPGFGIGLLLSLFVPVGGTFFLYYQGGFKLLFLPYDFRIEAFSFIVALLGAAVGAFFIWGVGAAYKRIRGIEGMGFGDVKLMAMVGAFLGVKLTVLTLVLGSVAGSLAGFAAMLIVFAKRMRRPVGAAKAWNSAKLVLRHYEMPFGVFLGIMALVAQWFGDRMMAWYMALYY